jgi:hypothetical protein
MIEEAAAPSIAAQTRRTWRLAPSLYTVATVAVLGAIFVVALAPRLDTDLWWHLLDGRFILLHGSVPMRDTLSFTAAGQPWTDHEWLSELLLYGLYRMAGLWGTIVAFAVIICLTYGLVFREMLERGAHVIVALFVLVGAFIASSPTWGARPQMITLLFLAVYSLALYRYEVTGDRRLLIVFPAVMLLWTNLHGGWVLGLALLVLWICGAAMNRLTRRPGTLSAAALRALAIAAAVTVLMTALNPNGLREVLYPLVWVLPTAYTNVLSEWVSPDFHMLQFMVFEFLLLLLMAAAAVARPRLNWQHLIVLLAFTYLALSEGRNVAVWTVVVTPILARYIQDAGPALRALFPQLHYQRRPVRGGVGSALNLGLLVMVGLAYTLEAGHFINPDALSRSEAATFPAASVNYLDRHQLPPRVFASYAWGGYLLWKGGGRYKDFIDGRANTLFDTATLAAYLQTSTAAPGWQRVLTGHGVQVVLVERGSPLAAVLAQAPGWRLRHSDPLAVVYQRTVR